MPFSFYLSMYAENYFLIKKVNQKNQLVEYSCDSVEKRCFYLLTDSRWAWFTKFMGTTFLHKTHSKLFFISMIFMMISLYCAYHLLQGAKGYTQLRYMEIHAASLDKDIAKLKDQRLALEDKVSRLRSPQIDADMLEQQAVYFLGPQSSTQIVLQ